MVAIGAYGLSKRYRIYRRPHDRLLEWLGRRPYADEIWALRDVEFEVPPGATVGIIGENGAGKSTLLQIVAGTLRPTTGRMAVNGRLSALLELGAGFHPEFTGRENIFMAGSILGFSSREMAERIEDIAAFAEIGEFLERPVKTYSSGMFVRLAFSIATSIDPEILVIDEVLAVGDQYFQKKCVDRIEAFRRAGKTILFCSHNLYQVRSICDQTIWLAAGRVAMRGETGKVVDAYQNLLRERVARQASAEIPGAVTGPRRVQAGPWIARIWLEGAAGAAEEFVTGELLAVSVAYQVAAPPTAVNVGVSIFRNDGVQCFATATHVSGFTPPSESATVTLRLPRLPLLAGEYAVTVYLLDDSGLHVYDRREREARFVVPHRTPALGLVYLDHRWESAPGGPRSGGAAEEALSVVSVEPATGPWADLCQEALTRQTPRLLDRVFLDPSTGVGAALEKTRGQFLALLHPAVAVGPGWAEGLIEALGRDPAAGAAGPLVAGAQAQGSVGYQDVEGFLGAVERQRAAREAPHEVADLDPSCLVFPRAVLSRLDPATPLFTLHSAIRAAGFPLLLVPSVLVHSFSEYFTHGRPEVLEVIPPDARRILDVGCGAGALGRALKASRSVEVIGVERDPGAVRAARAVLDQVIECDLDQAVPELSPGSFDCLVFADVLEHLRDPWSVLAALVRALRPGGTVVACLPNVRHWSVIRGLLEGEWRYLPAGLLDRSHLRFFTRASGEELLTGAGLVVRSLSPLRGELPETVVSLAKLLAQEGLRVETLAEEADVIQYLFVAERPRGDGGG